MRGKKYDTATKEKVIAMLATEPNIQKISDETGIPTTTISTWKKDAEKDEEFVQLRREKKAAFVMNAWEIIDKSVILGKRRIDRALEHEEELDMLLDEIAADQGIPAATKQALINKVRTLQIQTIKDLSTFIGTLYDKAALASDDPTSIQKNEHRFEDDLMDLIKGKE